jgi:PPOX class probable F420-dependent enzyme
VTELPSDVRTLFDGPNYAHVATLLPDGAPHSVPVWVGLEGERIVFLTGPTSRKARNLERDPRNAISVTDRTGQPYPVRTGKVVYLVEPGARVGTGVRVTGWRIDLRPECVVDGLLESHRTPLG